MSTTPPSPRAVALPRTEASNYVGSNSWVVILQEPSGVCHGGLRKLADQIDGKVNISVACEIPNKNDQGLAFPSALTLRFMIPHTGKKQNKKQEHHLVTVKMYAEGLKTKDVRPVNDSVKVPTYITSSSDYHHRRTHLYKVSLTLDPKGIISHGLFIESPFSDDYACTTLKTLQNLFSTDIISFDLFVRADKRLPLVGPFQNLEVRQRKDIQDEFYVKFLDKIIPVVMWDAMSPIPERPVVRYNPSSSLPVSLNVREMCVKYAMGVTELQEYQQGTVEQFNKTQFDLKVFALEDGGEVIYFGLLKPQSEIALTPRDGDRLQLKFVYDGTVSNDQWRAKVIAPLRHYLSNYINIHLYRPRKAHPPDTVQYVREKEVLGFVETELGLGQLAGVCDEETFRRALEDTPTLTTMAKIEVSETTAQRQMYALEAMMRGQRFNYRTHKDDSIYQPWSDDKDVAAFSKFLLLQDSVPKSRNNWLGKGINHVQHLSDDDQQDAINNLFCNAPSPVGILVGPAGTGKTVLMATMITAHVLAYDTQHIVGSPSNVGAEVAARKIQDFFNSHKSLSRKIVMRAYHDGPETCEIAPPSNTERTRKSSSTQLSDSETGVYAADGWYNQADVEAKKSIKSLFKVIEKNKKFKLGDPRRNEFDQSPEYHALCVAGFANFPANECTIAYGLHGKIFRELLTKLVENGPDALDCGDMRIFQQDMNKLFSHTIKMAAVLVGTLTYLGHSKYVVPFQRANAFWTDEAGQASVPDWLNVVARYKFKQAFLLGDPNQLDPVVVGPSPLTGFMRALEMSPIRLLIEANWPHVTLTDNRRSAAGIVDIPSKLFYQGDVKAHPNSASHTKHKWTTPVSNLIHDAFAQEGDGTVPSAVAYFSSEALSSVDKLTSSSFNPKNQAFCMNFIEKCVVELGVPPQDIGYASPYQAQCKRMMSALRKLEAHHKGLKKPHAFSLVKVAPIDSYQGGSAKIMCGDFTSSEKLGFMSARGRNCVLLTRAEDFALYIGNKHIRAPHEKIVNNPAMAFSHASGMKVCRDLEVDHPWMSHRFA